MGFVENVKNQIAVKASHCNVAEADMAFVLHESGEGYNNDCAGKTELLSAKHPFLGRKPGRYKNIARRPGSCHPISGPAFHATVALSN